MLCFWCEDIVAFGVLKLCALLFSSHGSKKADFRTRKRGNLQQRYKILFLKEFEGKLLFLSGDSKGQLKIMQNFGPHSRLEFIPNQQVLKGTEKQNAFLAPHFAFRFLQSCLVATNTNTHSQDILI